MTIKIFYSWQSDLPNNTNRTVIKTALDNVAKSFNGDVESADREIEIDTATNRVFGTISIADRILKKIDECNIFIADVSIIGKIDSFHKNPTKKIRRKTPNPNVLFELGYAWKTLGEEQIISVINTAYGTFEDLPFDLRGKTMISYSISKDEETKALERKRLEQLLNDSILAVINSRILGNRKINTIPPIRNKAEIPSISRAERIRRRLEHQQYRGTWLESINGVTEARYSVEEIFDFIEKIYNEEKDAHESMRIVFQRQQMGPSPHFWLIFRNDFYFRLSWSPPRYGNSLEGAGLYFVLSLRRDFKELISEANYLPDVNEEHEVVWYKDNVPNNKLTASELAQMFFNTFIGYIESTFV